MGSAGGGADLDVDRLESSLVLLSGGGGGPGKFEDPVAPDDTKLSTNSAPVAEVGELISFSFCCGRTSCLFVVWSGVVWDG